MLYRITHSTAYDYDNQVSVSHHVVRATPRNAEHQRRLEYELVVEPPAAVQQEYTDYFGNVATFLTVEGAHGRFVVTARSRVEVTPATPPQASATPPWEKVRELFQSGDLQLIEPGEFVFPSPLARPDADIADYARQSFVAEMPLLEAAVDLMSRIHEDFAFDSQATTVATPLQEFFHKRRGVCQDFAQFQIACLRSLGLPARYVSGYLETIPPPGRQRLAGADASHAWLSVFLPGYGWVDLDPTNNLLPSDRHITVAYGRDYSDISPIRGVLVGSGSHVLSVAVDVLPIEPVVNLAIGPNAEAQS